MVAQPFRAAPATAGPKACATVVRSSDTKQHFHRQLIETLVREPALREPGAVARRREQRVAVPLRISGEVRRVVRVDARLDEPLKLGVAVPLIRPLTNDLAGALEP